MNNSQLKKIVRSLSNRFGSSSKAFTLIESLAVIAIIGILLSLGTYVFAQAQAQARDTVRKSDLNQIAEAFDARYLDKTCTDQTAVGVYPGETVEQTNSQKWLKVSQLSTYSDGCGTFTHYLPTIPNDVRSPNYSYYFNLSTTEQSGSQTVPALAKHFRLTTSLEHQFAVGSPEQLECVRLSHVWINSFGGQPYDCDQHVIATAKTSANIASKLVETANAAGGLNAPTGLTATAGDGQVVLNWTAATFVPPNTSYNVKRSAVAGGPYTLVTNVSGVTFTDTGLTDGTTYYYRVYTYNGGLEWNGSAEASATPAAAGGANPTPCYQDLNGNPIANDPAGCMPNGGGGTDPNGGGGTNPNGGGGGTNTIGTYNFFLGQ